MFYIMLKVLIHQNQFVRQYILIWLQVLLSVFIVNFLKAIRK